MDNYKLFMDALWLLLGAKGYNSIFKEKLKKRVRYMKSITYTSMYKYTRKVNKLSFPEKLRDIFTKNSSTF